MKVLVSGSSGRMSKRITKQLAGDKEIQAVYGLEKKNHQDIGKKLSDVAEVNAKNIKGIVEDDIKKIIKKIDVIVEFTAPDVTLDHLKQAEKNKKAIVIGTTGFNDKQLDKIKSASTKIPVLLSPNMSIGVNTVFKILKDISRNLPKEYNVEIIETHHKDKKDAPSGTAKKMAEIIAKQRGIPIKSIIYGRKGHIGKRPDNQICIHAVRGGSVVGKHRVRFISDEDEIEITHNASSRDVFAKGAVSAVKFIYKKKKGFYTTEDII